ncbi:MAG: ABC transporter substrate-binding protein [Anaerolineaceae bacterium]|nr:ABC transporter substrate-binding protein [Anaerolineaceae bacterium]
MKNIIIFITAIIILASTACASKTPASAVEEPVPTIALVEDDQAQEGIKPTEPIDEPTTTDVSSEDLQETKIVVDSRGVEVEIPVDPQRVVSVSDALVEEVMTVFGIQDRVIGIGSTCLIRDFTYDFETIAGEKFSYSGGMNPANYLNPDLIDQPFFVKPGTEMNFETLASLEPDVLIIDVGACTLPWKTDKEAMEQGIERLESLGIPTIVLMGPNSGGTLEIGALSGVIKILGEVFNHEVEAEELAVYLEDSIQLVIERTQDIPEDQRATVLLLGLNPDVRTEGGVGQVSGNKDIQSYFVEEIVHAKNAFSGETTSLLNLEQILALDPEVIILPTWNGYHPPRELYEVNHFQNIQSLKAIENHRVGALPWSPCNCDKRLEYPIDVYVIAKVTYPELFEDIDLSEWILQFYQDVYKISEEDAMGLLEVQWMEWTLEE